MALKHKGTRRPHGKDENPKGGNVPLTDTEVKETAENTEERTHRDSAIHKPSPYFDAAPEAGEPDEERELDLDFGGRSKKELNHPGEQSREIQEERENLKKKKRSRIKKIVLCTLVELVTLACIAFAGIYFRYMNLTQAVDFNVEKVKNDNIDITMQQQMSGYWTVAVFGLDSRDGNVKQGNADVQMIVSIDMGSGDIKIASVYRDTYLNLGNGTRYAKINEAYADGGPEQAVRALNKNLDLNIQHYATFNWHAVADAITMLGGVDVEITPKLSKELNAYIHETAVKSGINAKNPAAEYVKGTGMQHLDGVQAVGYARLRHSDTDFKRTERQREILAQMLEKAKHADLQTLNNVINTVLPQIAFNIDAGDILQLAKGIGRYNIVGSQGFPTDLTTMRLGNKGDIVVPKTLSSNVVKLHQFLFEDQSYKPSSAVYTYSNKIAEDTRGGGSSGAGNSSGKTKAEEEDSTGTSKSQKSSRDAENGESRKSTKKATEEDRTGEGSHTDNKTSSKGTKESGETRESSSISDQGPAESKGENEKPEKTKEETKESREVSPPTETSREAPAPAPGGGDSSPGVGEGPVVGEAPV